MNEICFERGKLIQDTIRAVNDLVTQGKMSAEAAKPCLDDLRRRMGEFLDEVMERHDFKDEGISKS